VRIPLIFDLLYICGDRKSVLVQAASSVVLLYDEIGIAENGLGSRS